MISAALIALYLMGVVPGDVAPPGPFDDGSGSGNDWVVPAVVAFAVVAAVALIAIGVVIRRRR